MTKQNSHAHQTCAEIPEFERLNYFYGQMLGAADFRSEQAYFREKLKLHNRCLHGYGVVCGLEVIPVIEETCCPPEDAEQMGAIRAKLQQIEVAIDALQGKLEADGLDDDERKQIEAEIAKLSAEREQLRRKLEGHGKSNLDGSPSCDDDVPGTRIKVQCGLALDCEGNEIVLRQAVLIDLWALLGKTGQRRLREAGRGRIYLGICYCGEPINPTRPIVPDSCGAVSDCNFGKTRESVRFTATLDAPKPDERCETCCAGCGCECQLLAAIDWHAGSAIGPAQIDNSLRRAIGTYEPTVITGISWEQGKTYSPSEAKEVLGTEREGPRSKGIEIAFSRPVYAETLTPGVIDVWRVQGGRGLRGMISNVECSYVDKPDSGLVSSVFYRDDSGETLNDGDRIIVIVRGDFILDHCCKPLDGNHVGGRVPQLEAYRPTAPAAAAPPPPESATEAAKAEQGPTGQQAAPEKCGGRSPAVPCRLPPGGIGPWTSGNGSAGGTFESWFYID
ncbi:MAG: hypothetical protein ACKOPM_10595 [Novosphingobium sp.]